MNAVKLYRVSKWFYERKIIILAQFFYYLNFLLFNSVLPPTAYIGAMSRCNYGGIGVVIHSNAAIGKNVVIGTNVTVGGNFSGVRPTIGDNVYISTGAKILGCNIGSNVIVGANSVVITDIPDNVVVAGVPGKVIRPVTSEETAFLKRING